ncbi:hypothetical protein M405DRAFT_209314 [Rhizopogon salebrosus TDB-379]|nr:hypothetical protein M405DRAFT_209314 [Rhizopogon salebrosus TDB-379]
MIKCIEYPQVRIRIHAHNIVFIVRADTHSRRTKRNDSATFRFLMYFGWSLTRSGHRATYNGCTPLLQELRQQPMTRGGTLPWALLEFRWLSVWGSERLKCSDR